MINQILSLKKFQEWGQGNVIADNGYKGRKAKVKKKKEYVIRKRNRKRIYEDSF